MAVAPDPDARALSPGPLVGLVTAVALAVAACASMPGADASTTTSTTSSTTVTSGPVASPEQPGEEYEEYKRQIAESMRLENPPEDVEFERYTSPDEYAAVMVPCLVEQGMPAHPLPDGGIGFGVLPEDQFSLQREALYRCLVRYPTHPRYTEPPTDDQILLIYEYWTGDLTDCLESEGYPVSEPPTFQVFVSNYGVSGVEIWHPYPEDDNRLNDPDEWYRLNEVCPQTLPIEVLYPDN